MADRATVNVTEVINNQAMGRPRIAIVVLCGLIALLDAFDLQIIGLAGPAMTKDLNIAPQAFGAVFSAALAGLAVGAFTLGPAADRIGRKRVLVGSVFLFGILTFITATATSLNELLIYRFIGGLGFGGAMPSFISLTSEYTPKRLRATVVGLLWAAFPFGGFVGSLLASRMVPALGWQSLFYLGGALSILLAVVLVFALPESIGYLVASGAPAERIGRLLRRVCPGTHIPENPRFILDEERAPRASVRHLFSDGRTSSTVLLWGSYFLTFMLLALNTAWSPTLLKAEGVPVSDSALAMAVFNLGSVVGTSLAGFLVTRYSVGAILPAAFLGAAAALAAVGQAAPAFLPIALCQGLIGLFLGCGSSGLIALAALLYPTSIRSTGVGWAMGMGRFGSFVGPLAVGVLVSQGWSIGVIFAALGAPALVAAGTAFLIGRENRAAPGEEPLGTPVAVRLGH